MPKLANASPCSASEQCINGQCADNVCCNAACGGCKACNVAGYVGTCSNVPAGQDPHGTCSITSCQSACNGAGACGPAAAGETCASNSCVNQPPDATAYGRPSGANANVASCNGSTQSCPSPAPSSCSGHTCDGDQCNLSCIDNSDCVADTVCVGGECQACASSADCYSGAPLCTLTPYGTACDCAGDPDCFEGRGCNNGPGDCTLAGMGSVCVATFYCACNTGDGACNGRAPRCIASPGGSCSCGTVQGSICRVGQLCTDATASGTCKIAPGFPCTAVPADCASGTCGAGGLCTQLPAGKPCAHGSECTSGLCGAGWVCT